VSRTISAGAMASITSQETGNVWLAIMKITHPDLSEDICIVNNTQDIVYDGVTYNRYSFAFQPPSEDEGQSQPAKVTIDNVSREIVLAIRSINSAPTIEAAIIMVTTAGVVTKEAGWWVAELSNVTYNDMTIQGSVAFNIQVRDTISLTSYNNIDFMGLYG